NEERAHLDRREALAQGARDETREVSEGEDVDLAAEDLEEVLGLALSLDAAELVGDRLEDAHRGGEHAQGSDPSSIVGLGVLRDRRTLDVPQAMGHGEQYPGSQ